MTFQWLAQFEDQRVRRFWVFSIVAFFLHGFVDPFVTYLAVNIYNVGVEANPLLAGPLNQGLSAFIVIHIPLYLGFFAFLCAFTWLFSRASPSETAQVYKISRIVWVGIIIWGLVIVGNNVLVLIQGLF